MSTKLRVPINAQAASGQKSGIGHYIANLLEALIRTQPDLEMVAIAPPPESGNHMSTPQRFLWDQRGFPRGAAASRPDILHQTAFAVPAFRPAPVVCTIHDLIPMRFPELMSRTSRAYFNQVMPFSYRFADRFVTHSVASKNDIVEFLGIASERITVAPLAAADWLKPVPKARAAETVKKFGIDGPYALSVCTLEPRKNLPFLIRAFEQAQKNTALDGFKLVLAGKIGWGTEEMDRLIAEHGLADVVIRPGYVPDEDLPALYSGASFFLFPSLFEGFGLPPLEAMQCGCATVASNASSLPEVVGDAGLLLDPKDEDAWAKAIVTLVKDAKMRQSLSEKGVAQAARFSWDETARVTAEVYRDAAKRV